MNQSDLVSHLLFWLYRLDAYLLVNVIEDPAWLALMFC